VNNSADNSSILDSVDARTRLAGSNTMELLLFSLGTKEVFGINVFKVREITRTPAITRAPNLPNAVEGVVSLRGSIIPVISLAKLVGAGAAEFSNQTMMVTEFSRHVQGFLMSGVDRIVRVEWNKVRAPDPMLVGENGHITAITELPGGQLVSILDVEHILSKVYGESEVPELEAAPRSESASTRGSNFAT
jgi:two-component system chemotaxis response regulator CheV